MTRIAMKASMKTKSTFSANSEFYVSEYLMVMKSTNDDKYDMPTNKTSKFLFCNFNDYLNRQMWPVEKVRHTIISENKHVLLELQRKEWLYFTEKILEMFEKENLELEKKDDKIDNLEKKFCFMS